MNTAYARFVKQVIRSAIEVPTWMDSPEVTGQGEGKLKVCLRVVVDDIEWWEEFTLDTSEWKTRKLSDVVAEIRNRATSVFSRLMA